MNIKKLFGAGIVAGAVAISSIGGAAAAVTFDPETGKGFVGKGDVQVPFGWNDSKLQQNATGVTFGYSSTSDDEYDVTCEWDTGNKKKVHHIQTKSATVGSTVAYDVTKVDRKNPNGKVTGFNLTGIFGTPDESSEGSVPVVGEACPDTGNDAGTDSSVTKLITDVVLLSSTSTEALTAYHNASGLSATIWPPPPAPEVVV